MDQIQDWTSLDTAARQSCLASARGRAEALNKILNAFVAIEPSWATAGGRLSGLPYAAKDMLRTSTHQPSGGLAGMGDLGIVGDSDLLDRLDAAGAVRIGFTQMTELAYEPSGYNASRGRVKNPWSLDHVPGGSSSGSAAAVASGAVAVAIGSDTGGSLRIPAHCCGITAWKPTYGLVSTRGAMPLAPPLDTIGLLARGASDLLATAPAMAHLPASAPLGRIVAADDVLALCTDDIKRAHTDVVEVLSSLPMPIERVVALPTIDAVDAHALTIMFAESARMHRGRIDDPRVPSVLRRRLAKGLEVSEATLNASIAALPNLVRDFEAQILRDADAILLPVMPINTPAAAECDPASERFSPKTLYAMSRLTRWVNALGFPAVALPAGFDRDGLPVAMQIVGRPGSDLALLDLVRHVQAMTDWHGRVPTAIADLVPQPEPAP